MNQQTSMSRRWIVGSLTAGALAVGVGYGLSPAQAATTPAATTPPPGGTSGQRAGETVLTGTNAAKATAAALAAVPGGTVDKVETDADGAVYEAHMTKADGTKVTVKFDKNFAVTAIQAGMGAGPAGDRRGGAGGGTATAGAAP
jgi:hypothetical protein